MRSKTLGINVRVTPAEKEKLSENALLLRTFSIGISEEVGAWKKMSKPQPMRKSTRLFGLSDN